MAGLVILVVSFLVLIALTYRSSCICRFAVLCLASRFSPYQQFRFTLYSLFLLTVGLIASLFLKSAFAAPSVVENPLTAVVVRASKTQTGLSEPAPMEDGVDAGHYRFESLPRSTLETISNSAMLPLSSRLAVQEETPFLRINPRQARFSDALFSSVHFSDTYDWAKSVTPSTIALDSDNDALQTPIEMALADVVVIGPAVHQYFVPFDDRDLLDLFRESNRCQGEQATQPVGEILASRISLTVSSDGTNYFYDHYEDGYDEDPLTPGPTTEIGTLGEGETRIFADDIDTTDLGTPNSIYYGGRDRITVVGEEAAVIRAAYPSLGDSPIGSRLAGAWEIEEVSEWGTTYIVPVGEDWGDYGAQQGHDFEFAGASFMALQDGTEIRFNDIPVPIQPLKVGETFFVDGEGNGAERPGLNSGDRIIASGPIQAHLYSSICDVDPAGGPWSGNGYTLEPSNQWSYRYWSPVPNRTSCDDADVDIFLFNPHPVNSIDVTIDDGTRYTSIQLDPGPNSIRSLIGGFLSESRGVEIYSQGAPFWGIVNMDTLGVAYEWGYSLIPADELTSQVVVGWAPGNSTQPPLGHYPPSGNLAWVTAITDTVIYADFDQDGIADPMDCNGDGAVADSEECNGYDESSSHNGVPLFQGQTLRIADPTDANLASALIFTENLSERIAVVWGQDPCIAGSRQPYLDLGYTALPVSVPSVFKFDSLSNDVDGSGDVTMGDILAYSIVVFNNGHGPMNNVTLTDVIPYTHTNFIVGSLVTAPPIPVTYEYDDGDGSFSYIPVGTGVWDVDPKVQQLRIVWPEIGAQQTVTTSFQVEIELKTLPRVLEFSNQAVIDSDETNPKQSRDPDDPLTPGTIVHINHPRLKIEKLVNANTVKPGDLLTYTVVVSNVGMGTAFRSLVLDSLPPWLTYITGTLDLTWPMAQIVSTTIPITYVSTFNETYGDNFDNISRTFTTGPDGNDGTLKWTSPISRWTEYGDGTGDSSTGDIQVVSTFANSPPGALWLSDTDNVESGSRRCADLSDFAEPHLSYQIQGNHSNVDVDDTFSVEITSTTAITRLTVPYNNTTYVSIDRNLSAFAFNSPVCVSFIAAAGMDDDDFYRIDDVFIYEASPERYTKVNLINENTIISYSTLTDTNPVTHTRIFADAHMPGVTSTMYMTHAFPFPPQSHLTATFRVRVGYPLTDELQINNTANITATNLFTTPYPLIDDESTQVQSNHVLTITHLGKPGSVAALGQLVTYTIFWQVAGDEPAPGVVVTDNLHLPFVSFVSCGPPPKCQGETSRGSGEVVWELGDTLRPMSGIPYDSGWLTLTVKLEQRPAGGIITNTVTIDDDTDAIPDQDDRRTPIGSYRVYLPVILHHWPPKPPTLYPIYNPEKKGDYSVQWGGTTSTHQSTITYELWQDQRCDCQDPVLVYSGTNNSYSFNSQDQRMGYYCYKVRACDVWGSCGGWSNEECTDVLWEYRPYDNGRTDLADGPLCFGKEYRGYPEDEWDVFKVCLDTRGEFIVDLTNYTAEELQFSLADQDYQTCDYLPMPIPDPNAHYTLSCSGPEGMYFVFISTDKKRNNNPYTLQATLLSSQNTDVSAASTRSVLRPVASYRRMDPQDLNGSRDKDVDSKTRPSDDR